jgi:predicted nuclease of predicted toxin-antitoxin system
LRFLLDAHVSGPRIGRRLETQGHDVRALDQEPSLEGLEDEEVLALAGEEKRILITHNIRDFPDILREWAMAQRSHPGVILVYGIDHSEFELTLRGIGRLLDLHAEPASWIDLTTILDRAFASS